MDPVVTAAVVIPFLANLVGAGTSVVAVPSTLALSTLSIVLGYINARINIYIVNIGLKGVWAALAFKALQLIFAAAAKTVARGAGAVGGAAQKVSKMVRG